MGPAKPVSHQRIIGAPVGVPGVRAQHRRVRHRRQRGLVVEPRDRVQEAVFDHDGAGEDQRPEATRVPGDEERADQRPEAVAHQDKGGVGTDGVDEGGRVLDEPVDGGDEAAIAFAATVAGEVEGVDRCARCHRSFGEAVKHVGVLTESVQRHDRRSGVVSDPAAVPQRPPGAAQLSHPSCLPGPFAGALTIGGPSRTLPTRGRSGGPHPLGGWGGVGATVTIRCGFPRICVAFSRTRASSPTRCPSSHPPTPVRPEGTSLVRHHPRDPRHR